jgi:hypothetical protein
LDLVDLIQETHHLKKQVSPGIADLMLLPTENLFRNVRSTFINVKVGSVGRIMTVVSSNATTLAGLFVLQIGFYLPPFL